MSANINGTTGQLNDHYNYWIYWQETDVNVANNTSKVSAWVYVQRVGNYRVESSQNDHDLWIDGTKFSANPYVNMNPSTTPQLLVSGSKTITHDSDGGKSITISSSGQICYIAGAYYSPQSGSASGTATLTTIPRGAKITSTVNLVAGNNLGFTLDNPGNLWIQLEFFVHDGGDYEPKIVTKQMGQVSSGTITFTQSEINAIFTQLGSNTSRSALLRCRTYSSGTYGTQIGDTFDRTGTVSRSNRATTSSNANLTIGNNKSVSLSNPGGYYVRMEYWINGDSGWYRVKNQNNGTGTSGTFTMSSTDNNNMYSRMVNSTSKSARIRIYTYTSSSYDHQIGDYHEVSGTVSVNQSINTPTFTDWSVANVGQDIVVKDKYDNTLITSNTSTLLGADTKVLKDYSKVRATITEGNKAVALNYATMQFYRFTAGSKFAQEDWETSGTVTLDLDKVDTGSYSVRATDSRNLNTTVNESLTLISPTSVNIWGLRFTRADMVGSVVTMSFIGKMWKGYFGGGMVRIPGGQ